MFYTPLDDHCVCSCVESEFFDYANVLGQYLVTFSGASNSSKMGCDKNSSLDFRQSPLISCSASWTFFPGLAPLTSRSLAIMLSMFSFPSPFSRLFSPMVSTSMVLLIVKTYVKLVKRKPFKVLYSSNV